MKSGKKVLLILSLFICISVSYPVLAQESSPSSDIKDKLKQLQDEIASKAAAMKNEVSKKLLNKSYIGDLSAKNPDSLTVNLRSGTGSVNVNEFTEYIIKSRTYEGPDGLKNLANGDSIATLGDVDDKGILTAKRIIKFTKPVVFKKVVHGNLNSVGKDSATLKTVQGDEFTLTFDKFTDYQLGKSDSSFDEIKINRRVIVVGEEIKPKTDKTGSPSATPSDHNLLVKYVYIFP